MADQQTQVVMIEDNPVEQQIIEYVDETQFILDESDDIVTNLESIAVSLEGILATGVSMDSAGFRMFNCAMNSNLRRLGLSHAEAVPSLETFNEPMLRRGATRIALESVVQSVKDTLSKIWEWIKSMFRKLGEWLGLFDSQVKKQEKQAEDLDDLIKNIINEMPKLPNENKPSMEASDPGKSTSVYLSSRAATALLPHGVKEVDSIYDTDVYIAHFIGAYDVLNKQGVAYQDKLMHGLDVIYNFAKKGELVKEDAVRLSEDLVTHLSAELHAARHDFIFRLIREGVKDTSAGGDSIDYSYCGGTTVSLPSKEAGTFQERAFNVTPSQHVDRKDNDVVMAIDLHRFAQHHKAISSICKHYEAASKSFGKYQTIVNALMTKMNRDLGDASYNQAAVMRLMKLVREIMFNFVAYNRLVVQLGKGAAGINSALLECYKHAMGQVKTAA